MSLVTGVAGSTKRPQLLHHTKSQQSSSNGTQANNKKNLNFNNGGTTPQVTVNCMQHSSPPTPTSIKNPLSTSPIAGNYIGSTSLFSFESGVVLSGSSGCCSLSNSPSSSSSSNSYLTPQPLESSCNKLSTSSGNQLCLNTSTNLEDSFASGTCQLNASLLAAVNGDLDDENVMPKSLRDSSNQTETLPNTSTSLQNQSNSDESGQILIGENMHNPNTQQSTAESTTCLNSEDARTLQLAVELTMMNLNQVPSPKSDAPPTLSPTSSSNHFQQLQSHHIHHSTLETHQPYSSVGNPYHLTTKVFLQTQSQAAALINQKFLSEPNQDNIPLSNPNPSLATVTSTTTTDERSKKSQNMTECVPVPSSEHVAEIVGRQGCKIKALRAKTNTYIKTPVRNEEPVFVVTGRKEDVAKAKREILSAAEHFTLIRATRRTNDGMNGCSSNLHVNGGDISCSGQLVQSSKNSMCTTTALPGQITIQVRVPYRVVGLVVGPKGNTIKHIQHETQTYIVTPSRDKEPIFEVTGMPDNVQMARKQIEAHIATRTGNSLAIPAPPPPPPPPPAPAPAGSFNRLNENLPINQSSSFQSLNTLHQMLNDDLHSEILSSIYKNGIGSALEYNQIGCILNTTNNKCAATSNSFNGYIKNELNSSSISSVNDIQRQVTISSGSTCNDNIQLNCSDLINNIIDPNTATATQFAAYEQNKNFPLLSNNSNPIRNVKSVVSAFSGPTNDLLNQQINFHTNTLLTRSCSSASSTASSSKSFNNNSSCNNTTFWKSLNGGSSSLGAATSAACSGTVNDSIDIDEGIGESPLYSWGLPNTLAALTNSYCSPTSTSISPTDSLFGEHNNKTTILQQQQIKISPKTKLLDKLKRKVCWMCHEKDMLATLIPCGHTIFCSLCANRLCQQNDASCPICSTQIFQALRVH